MIKREIRPACEALKKIRMPKLQNKEVKNALIKAHLFLLGEAKKFNEELENLRIVHLGAFEEKLQEINAKKAQLNSEKDEAERRKLIDEINSHTDVLDAVNAFNKAVYDKEAEEVNIDKIDGNAFVEDYGQLEDYDPAVVEAIFPLFK